jgi:hypothetical protein
MSISFFQFPLFVIGQHLLNYDLIKDTSQWVLAYEDQFNYTHVDSLHIDNGGDYEPDDFRCGSDALADQSWSTLDVDPNQGFLTIKAARVPGRKDTICNGEPDTFSYISGGIRFAKYIYSDYFPYDPCSGTNAGLRYGLLEVRCKVPNEPYCRPAFWTYNGGEEFDIFEHTTGTGIIQASVHDHCGLNNTNTPPFIHRKTCPPQPMWPNYDTTASVCKVEHQTDFNLSDDFHTYSLMWTNDGNDNSILTWFFDGRELHTETRANIANCPHDFRLNLGMGFEAYYSGVDTAKFIIDYVRIYQQKVSTLGDPYLYSHDNILPLSGESDLLEDNHKNFSINKTNGNVFAALATTGAIILYDSNNNKENVSSSYPWGPYQVGGDITAGNDDHIYYRGQNGRLQQYYRSNLGGWEHATIDWTSVGYEIHQNCGSLDYGDQSGLFYRGTDNQMHKFHYTGGQGNGWVHSTLDIIASGDGNRELWKIDGDVSAVFQRVYYRGVDGKLQSYYWANNTWNHETINANDLVSTACGAIEANGRASVFYRGINNRLYHSYKGEGGIWVHELLPASKNIQYVAGDIAISKNKVYYKGGNGQVQFYQYHVNHWMHTFLNKSDEYPTFSAVNNGIEISPINDRIYFDYLLALTNPKEFLFFYENQIEDDGDLVDIQCNTLLNVCPPNNLSPLVGEIGNILIDQQNKLKNDQIEIFPNPTKGIFNVTLGNEIWEKDQLTSISVFDASGRNIKNIKCSDECSNLEINISTENDGIFFIRIIQNNDIIIKKLVKQ